MQISSRFTMAIHMFACIDTFKNTKMTSDFLAGSIGTNPVIIRKLLGQLKAAGLIEVSRGTGGVRITRPLDEITFLDIYRAVECSPEEELFHFHDNPNQLCPVGRNIHHVLDEKLLRVQKAMEAELSSITLADVKKDTDTWIQSESRRTRPSGTFDIKITETDTSETNITETETSKTEPVKSDSDPVYQVLRIDEDLDFGCEERTADSPVMVIVTLKAPDGSQTQLRHPDRLLYENKINEGDYCTLNEKNQLEKADTGDGDL